MLAARFLKGDEAPKPEPLNVELASRHHLRASAPEMSLPAMIARI